MPGYGGLEVCQRLKESDETMKIPVLLSVGKMEPFKPEEARRVRADGHIVKPFEASELLAALARLEDRIVPQTDAQRIRMPKKSQDKEKDKKARFWHSEPEEESAEPKAVLAAESAPSVEAKQAQPAETQKPVVRSEPEPVAPIEDNLTIHNQDAGDEAKAVAAKHRSTNTQEPEETAATFASAWKTEPSGAQGTTESSSDASADPAATPKFVSVPKETHSAAPGPEPTTVPEAAEPTVAAAEVAASGPRWVAENVALTAEEASIALETEMRQAQDVLSAATSPFQYQHPDPPVSELPPPPENVELPALPEHKEESGAAFAAAASTSAGASAEAVGSTVSETEPEQPVQSEAAAAWENWRQIRESVMSPQNAAAIAESVAEIAQASTPAQSSDASSSPAPVETNLASIVDSVLAELRPKLMEEIAKKMAAEKR
jgi:hypothetical protein